MNGVIDDIFHSSAYAQFGEVLEGLNPSNIKIRPSKNVYFNWSVYSFLVILWNSVNVVKWLCIIINLYSVSIYYNMIMSNITALAVQDTPSKVKIRSPSADPQRRSSSSIPANIALLFTSADTECVPARKFRSRRPSLKPKFKQCTRVCYRSM